MLRREQVNFASFVPAVLRPLLQHVEEIAGSLDFFRVLIAGAEVWYAGEYRRLRRLCGQRTRLISGYGVTEATIASTFFEGTDLPPDHQPLPLGRPLANTTVYVLDRYLQLVPSGVPGELHLGGASLARGYLGRPELTAEKFIPHPFSPKPGARLYKTGDRVRWRDDGNLEFLGRSDHQVKIRGFRVELGEIEAALLGHAAVREAVVVTRAEGSGGQKLAAYVVPSGKRTTDVGGLRDHLRRQLPEYMLPSAFVVLAALPRTPGGKIDRQALPAPDFSESLLEPESILPRTPLEETLATLWQEVLQVPRVGVHDNFFDLGGESLSAVRLVSRVRQEVNIELSVRELFQTPTIAALALHLLEQWAKSATSANINALLAEAESI